MKLPNEIRSDLPPTEEEFTGLWKLYLCSVAAVRARDEEVKNDKLEKVLEYLADLRLVSQNLSLNSILKSISDYVKWIFRPREVITSAHFDSTSGMLTGISGKISFSEPSLEAREKGVRPIREILLKLNAALKESGQTVWLLLDRLDVAFSENEQIEIRALRALFSAYKDMAGLDRIKLKLFIRSDTWDKVVASGYREATHAASPERTATLRWDNSLLFNVFIKRLMQSELLCNYLAVDRKSVFDDLALQELVIERIFPDKIDTGKNPKTFAWVCSRLQDGHEQATPRELVQFCSALRTHQLQRLENAAAPPSEELLFERSSFKAALAPVSVNRLRNTIFAEYPDYKAWIEGLRGKKSLQSANTLSAAWCIELTESNRRAELLSEIGVFKRSGDPENMLYEIPILYRSALQIIRGSEIGLQPEARLLLETESGDVDTNSDL